MKEGPREKPLGLDMPFDEALRRFIGVDPQELPESVKLAKKERAPPRSPPAGKPRKGAKKPLD